MSQLSHLMAKTNKYTLMEDIFIYGASGHGKVVIEIAEALKLNIVGIIDDNRNIKSVFDYQVIPPFASKAQIVLAIGNNITRKKIVQKNPNWHYRTLIHPKANISTRSKLGSGSVVMAGVTINTSVTIKSHCIINTNASIDHDCVIDNFAHISPNVALAGNIKVGEGAHIGIGASVLPNINIGKWSVVGAGAVVIEDVPDNVIVVGNPAKILKVNKEILQDLT